MPGLETKQRNMQLVQKYFIFFASFKKKKKKSHGDFSVALVAAVIRVWSSSLSIAKQV